MSCTTSTNLVVSKELLEEVDNIKEEFGYAGFMAIAGARAGAGLAANKAIQVAFLLLVLLCGFVNVNQFLYYL